MLAEHVGLELDGCKWIGIPFAGGMSEVFEMKALTINVNDKHRHVINMAQVMGDPTTGPKLYRQLRRIPFHPNALAEAQQECQIFGRFNGIHSEEMRFRWAVTYFVSAWMPRHGSSGTKGEFKVQQSIRWNASGGDSAKHYHGAVKAINNFRRTLRRCNFTTLDFREFLFKCKDEEGHGIYCDPPFFGPGDKYEHTFTKGDHIALRDLLAKYKQTRVVVRYYDTPFVRELYPNSEWTYVQLDGRKQTNDAAPEVLIINGPSYATV